MRKTAHAITVALVFLGSFAALTWLLVAFDRPSGAKDLPVCPLDAVEYRSPAFADDGWPSYKVMDRTAEQVTWIVRLNGEWVVL